MEKAGKRVAIEIKASGETGAHWRPCSQITALWLHQWMEPTHCGKA